jgi:nitrite reductase (NADH) small subunit
MSQWKKLCAVTDIPVLGARRVKRTQGADVAVFRTADDRVFALLDRCPHKGGPLSQGIVFGDRVACPLHNWSIGLIDGSAAAPDVGQTSTFSVDLRDGEVWLDADELASVALDSAITPCPGRCAPGDATATPGAALQAAATVDATVLIASAAARSKTPA